LGKTVSLSIEENSVKVVYASTKGRSITVTDALVMPLDRLDTFLAEEKTADFIVSVDFTSYFQETVYIPPAKRNLVRPLILSEIKKKNPVQEDITPLYYKTGEKTIDGRRMDEYFVFYVFAREVNEIVARFLARGKRISALYPSILAVQKILPRSEVPYLCLFETGRRKNIFLVSNGQILFTRSAQSIGEGILDFDLQNVNMTINYCRQTLRIEPARVLIMGREADSRATSVETSIPMEFFSRPDWVEAREDLFMDYLVPISAISRGRAHTVLPEDYRRFYSVTNVMKYSTRVFASLSVILLLLLLMNGGHYLRLRSEVSEVRSGHGDLRAVLEEHGSAREKLEKKKKIIDFINSMNGRPSVAGLLLDLSSLPIRALEVHRMDVASDGSMGLRIQMEGSTVSTSLLHSQQELDRIVEYMRSLKGMSSVTGELSLKSGHFRISAGYGGEGAR